MRARFSIFVCLTVIFEGFALSTSGVSNASEAQDPPPPALRTSSETSLFKISAEFYLDLWQHFLTRYDGDRCTFVPSCSEYSRQAVRRYGAARGVIMTADRLIRCHPRNLSHAHLVSNGREIDPLPDEKGISDGHAEGDLALLPISLMTVESEAVMMMDNLINSSKGLSESESKSLQLALSLVRQKKYEFAAFEFERFLLFYPETHRPEILYLLGLCRMLKSEWKSAESAFDLTISANGIADALQKKALLKRAASFDFNYDLISARQSWREYVRLFPSDPEVGKVKILVGTSYLRDGDWTSAAREFDQIGTDFADRPLGNLAAELSQDAKRFDNLPNRSTWLAGGLSALVPGLGYVYSNRYSDGIYALLINVALGSATYVSFKDQNSASGIFFGGLLSSFYLGNIYGSVSTALNYNENRKSSHLNQILHKANKYVGATSR